jgi:hypothetical protein
MPFSEAAQTRAAFFSAPGSGAARRRAGHLIEVEKKGNTFPHKGLRA